MSWLPNWVRAEEVVIERTKWAQTMEHELGGEPG